MRVSCRWARSAQDAGVSNFNNKGENLGRYLLPQREEYVALEAEQCFRNRECISKSIEPLWGSEPFDDRKVVIKITVTVHALHNRPNSS